MSKGIKRIIAHWTGGSYNVGSIDKKHYHRIVSGSGNVVDGNFRIQDNVKIRKGRYAAHTYHSNTGSIGISCASMYNAKESPLNFGKYPLKEIQFEAMCKEIAKLCVEYSLAVTNKTVLTHAEVQTNLGIKQRGKWDIAVLKFKPKLKGAKACGDYMRKRVKYYIKMSKGVAITSTVVTPVKTKTIKVETKVETKKELDNGCKSCTGNSETYSNFWGWLLRWFRLGNKR